MSENVKSAVRTLRMLELFANTKNTLTLKHITNNLDIPKSSAFMLLNTLLREHYVEEVESGQFALSEPLKNNGKWLGGIIEIIRTEAVKEMEHLISMFGESVVLGCLTDNYEVRIINSRQSTREMGYIVAQNPTIPLVLLHGHAILPIFRKMKSWIISKLT